MKGCLVIVAFLVAGAALVVGVVVAVERNGSSQREDLTEAASRAEITGSTPETRGRATRQREGVAIAYVYDVDGQTFTSSTWVADYPVDLVVCIDPDDPAVHTVVTSEGAECGDPDLGTDDIRRAEQAETRG